MVLNSSPVLQNALKERLNKGELALTLMVRHARTVDIALAAKLCGFDGLFFDLQHSVIPEHEVSQMAVAAMNVGVAPIVRVPEKDYAAALRMLDNGALGIIMPSLRSRHRLSVLSSNIRNTARPGSRSTRSTTDGWTSR